MCFRVRACQAFLLKMHGSQRMCMQGPTLESCALVRSPCIMAQVCVWSASPVYCQVCDCELYQLVRLCSEAQVQSCASHGVLLDERFRVRCLPRRKLHFVSVWLATSPNHVDLLCRCGCARLPVKVLGGVCMPLACPQGSCDCCVPLTVSIACCMHVLCVRSGGTVETSLQAPDALSFLRGIATVPVQFFRVTAAVVAGRGLAPKDGDTSGMSMRY